MLFRISRPVALKTFYLMNWTAAILLAGFLHVSAAGFTQGKITLHLKDAPLEKVFSSFEEQSGFTIWYETSILKNIRPVTIDVQGVSLEEALSVSCKNQPLTYSISNKMVVIKEKKDRMDPPDEIDIHGTILNEKGDPVPGLSILVKGSKSGTTTDGNGRFHLQQVASNATLIISGSNIDTREEKINGVKELSLTVKTKVSKLDEIQVVAYGTTTQRLTTGSQTTVTSEEISRQPVANLLQTMEGRVPGMFIQSNSGFAGSNFNVQIRGIGSIAAGTTPLYIVDGIPFNGNSTDLISTSSITALSGAGNLSPLNIINPSDIESIDVLRGADATAIYGSRAANGVVIITTKRAKAGKAQLNASVYYGTGKVSRFIPMLPIQDYLALRRNAFANDGITPTQSDAPDLLIWDTTQNTDWQKKLIGGTAGISDAQVSISVGDINTRLLVGAGFHNETTVFPADAGDRRISGHLQADHSSTDKRFSFTMSVNYAIDNNKLVNDPTPYVNLPPDYPNPAKTGSITWRPNIYVEPFAQMNTTFTTKTNMFLSNGVLKYAFRNGLVAKVSMGYTQTNMDQNQLFPSTVLNPIFGYTPYAYFGSNNSSTWIIEPQLSYDWKAGSGNLTLLGGASLQQTNTESELLIGDQYSSDAQLANLAAAGRIQVSSNSDLDYRYASAFFRATYNLKNKYILNATYRRDGSSRFPPDHQFGNFGSVGAAWIFSEEEFIKNNIPVLSFGKIRSSYGVTGNDQVPDYQYLSSYQSTAFPYQVPGIHPARIANSEFEWETSWKFEAGLELGFWSDRLLLIGTYYQNRSGNQLVAYPIPTQTGFSSYQGNLPATIQNTGLELSLQAVLIKTTWWNWKIYGNLTLAKNKLLSFPNIEKTQYGTANLIVGQPLNMVWGYHYLGTDKELGTPLIADLDHDGNPGSYPGDYMPIANTMPTYYGGFGQTLSWKNWTFDFLFQFVDKSGIKLYNGIPGGVNNLAVSIANEVWEKPGDAAAIPRASTSSYDYFIYRYSDAGLYESASYMKLKNINLSYTFQNSIFHIPVFRLFILGQNIFTITSYKGYDPETSNSNSLPNLRIITFGVHAEF